MPENGYGGFFFFFACEVLEFLFWLWVGRGWNFVSLLSKNRWVQWADFFFTGDGFDG